MILELKNHFTGKSIYQIYFPDDKGKYQLAAIKESKSAARKFEKSELKKHIK